MLVTEKRFVKGLEIRRLHKLKAANYWSLEISSLFSLSIVYMLFCTAVVCVSLASCLLLVQSFLIKFII